MLHEGRWGGERSKIHGRCCFQTEHIQNPRRVLHEGLRTMAWSLYDPKVLKTDSFRSDFVMVLDGSEFLGPAQGRPDAAKDFGPFRTTLHMVSFGSFLDHPAPKAAQMIQMVSFGTSLEDFGPKATQMLRMQVSFSAPRDPKASLNDTFRRF